MTTQVAILLVILLAMSICFFTELLPISFTALMVPVMLQATGILTASQAWAGFANTTIITWYGLFIIGGAFNQPAHFHDIKNKTFSAQFCQAKSKKNKRCCMAASVKQRQGAAYNHPSENLSMQSPCLQSTYLK